jgi:hypothetical protein
MFKFIKRLFAIKTMVCPECGTIMQPEGGCAFCPCCGFSPCK